MSGRGARATRRNANAANVEMEIPAWLRQCMETIAQNGQAAAANVAPPAIDFPKLCKDFRNLGGKPYLGTESFVETRTWIQVCDRIFRDLGLEGNVRRLIASRNLEGEALCWWDIVVEETNEEEISWDDFKRRFEAQFISESEKGEQLEKFIHLKQGDMTAKEYVRSFNFLSKYGMDLIRAPTAKAKKFANGLNQPLKDLALSHLPMGATFEVLVEMALMHDSTHASSKLVVPKAKVEEKPNGKRKGPWKENRGNGKRPDIVCRRCGYRGHFERDCKTDLAKRKCFNCDQVGHIKNACPMPLKTGPIVRAYALDAVPTSSRPVGQREGKGHVDGG